MFVTKCKKTLHVISRQNCKVYQNATVRAKVEQLDWKKILRRNKKNSTLRASLPSIPRDTKALVYCPTIEWVEPKSDDFMDHLRRVYSDGNVKFSAVNKLWKGTLD